MYAYPGVGRSLNLSTGTASTGGSPTATVAIPYTTPTLSYSDYEPISDAMKTEISIKYASAPGSATTVQFSVDNTFATPTAFPLTLFPATADTNSFTSITEGYNGFIRISNTSGVALTSVKINKQVSTGY